MKSISTLAAAMLAVIPASAFAFENTCSRTDNPNSGLLCPSFTHRLTSFNQNTTVEPGKTWLYEFDGFGSPSQTPRLYHQWFDNPFDDDFDGKTTGFGACKFRFNAPAGWAAVDRIMQPATLLPCPSRLAPNLGVEYTESARRLGGYFLRRDPLLDTLAPVTIEFRLQIVNRGIANLQKDAVRFAHTSSHGQATIVLSPDCIRVSDNPTGSWATACEPDAYGNWNAVPFNTARPVVYRLVRDAGAGNKFKLYYTANAALDANSPYIEGEAASSTYTRVNQPGQTYGPGDDRWEFPHIDLGEHVKNSWAEVQQNLDTSGSYRLDYVRYTVGAFPPSATTITAPTRYPTSIPLNEPVAASPAGTPPSERNGEEFDELPAISPNYAFEHEVLQNVTVGHIDANGTFVPKSPSNPIPQGQGIARFNANLTTGGGYGPLFIRNHPYSILGNGDWVVEARVKVGPNHTNNAAGIRIMERMGSIDLLFSKDSVSLQQGIKPSTLSVPVKHENTDDFRIYRLMKFKGSNLVYLYIDNEPRPVLADFMMSAFSINSTDNTSVGWEGHEMRLTVGSPGLIMLPPAYSPDPENFPDYSSATADLFVDYVRWSPLVNSAHTY